VEFLDGIELWRVVGYAGVTPIVCAHVAAAIRRRGPDRRPRTVAEDAEELAITRLEPLPDTVRGALARGGVRVVEIPAEGARARSSSGRSLCRRAIAPACSVRGAGARAARSIRGICASGPGRGTTCSTA